jgi:hypothetical protein
MPEPRAARWLLLVHQLPPRPSNLRVQIWRRLQQVGAIVLRNSIYVLPNSSESREDFDWIRAEIVNQGGQVSVFSGEVVDGYTDKQLIDEFRRARQADYAQIIADAERLLIEWQRSTQRPSRAVVQREIGRLHQRLKAVRSIDYFAPANAGDADASLARLDRFLDGAAVPPEGERLKAGDYRNRVWLTRPRPGIDRMASAWLIRRFIDPKARFAFGAVSARDRRIPFDMPDAEFGHVGTHCTYETLMQRFAIADPGAVRIGHLVHDLDLKEARYAMPETHAVGRLVEGLREQSADDETLLGNGITMIDALHRSFATEARQERTQTQHRRRRSRR